MNEEQLHALYHKVHYQRCLDDGGRFDGYCKVSCGVMEITHRMRSESYMDQETVSEVSSEWYIEVGTYCIGKGRWEVIGQGKTKQEAIDQAANFLKECVK